MLVNFNSENSCLQVDRNAVSSSVPFIRLVCQEVDRGRGGDHLLKLFYAQVSVPT